MFSFCRVTGHSRGLPRPNYFPILPPISPADAKRFKTSNCKITCNYNPNHSYQPITKLIEESVVKCRITERSIFEYKFFLQVSGNENDQKFYYEIDDKLVIVPLVVEKELNRGLIREVTMGDDKLILKYLNRVKEYDLVGGDKFDLKKMDPTKGLGLKKRKKRPKRKRSALLGDLKSVFEQKERLAEIAEKKSVEKIQPDQEKIDLIRNKINKSAVTGEMINDVFIKGKYIDNVFVPGITVNGEFVEGIEREVNGKKKFIQGRILNGVFTPGQVISKGGHSEFIPGQLMVIESVKKFVPGLLVHEEEKNEDYFVPGRVEESNEFGIKFIGGELIETDAGLRFVCENNDQEIQVQTFEPQHEFEYEAEDVRNCIKFLETEFIGVETGSRKGSFDFLDSDFSVSPRSRSPKSSGQRSPTNKTAQCEEMKESKLSKVGSLEKVQKLLMTFESCLETPLIAELEPTEILKEHIEQELTKDLPLLLSEALNLAQILGKSEVVRELQIILQDKLSYETIVNDGEVIFILRQLVILKKLMEEDKTHFQDAMDTALKCDVKSELIEVDAVDLSVDPLLLKESKLLTELVFEDRFFTPPCDDFNSIKNFHKGEIMEDEHTESKRPRISTDDDFASLTSSVELFDNVAARHKVELGRSRKKISLKSADELQATPSEQLAAINRDATLRELIETEEEFVRDLAYLLDNYYSPDYKELFGSLKPILEFHKGILLEGFRYYANDPKMIARTFLRLERYFDLHALYISDEEPESQMKLESGLIGSHFEELTLELNDEKSLSDHLKLPLQRINDYQLIIQDLIDTQRIIKAETSDLEKALDLLLGIPQKISDKKFLSNIEGFHGNVFHLGRLLRHDWFSVTREEEVKQRYAFLFKSRILVTKVRKISDQRSVFVLKDIIKLPDYELEEEETRFTLKGAKTYIFESPVSNEWTDILALCIQPDVAAAARTEENIKQLKREGSLRRSSLWQQQSESFESQFGEQRRESLKFIEQKFSTEKSTKSETKSEFVSICDSSSTSTKTVCENRETSQIQSQVFVEEKVDESGEVKVSSELKISESGAKSVYKSVDLDAGESTLEVKVSTIGISKVDENKTVNKEKVVEISGNKVEEPKEKVIDVSKEKVVDKLTKEEKVDVIEVKGQVEKAVKISKEKVTEENLKEEKTLKEKVTEGKKTEVSKELTKSEQKVDLKSEVKGDFNPSSLTKEKESEEKSEVKSGEVKLKGSEKVEEIDYEEKRKLRRRSSVIKLTGTMANEAKPPPLFIKPIRSIECEPGENASLECVSECGVIITWLKGNRPLDDALADRVKITSSKDNKHSLVILNCHDDDAGLYTAKITNDKLGVATCSAVLTVHELTADERKKKIAEKNSPQFLVKFKDTELLKDTMVSFMFVVKGVPEPSITFYHDGMVLGESERRKVIKHPDDSYEFWIEKISEEDSGEYKVTAENQYGQAQVIAKVNVVDEKELFKGIEGKRLLNPGEEPVFDWYLNGRPFTPDEKLKVLFREEEDTLALVFQHVTPDDAGLYTCVAQTSGGKISCSAELTVQGAIHQLLREPSGPTIILELTDTEVSVGGSAMMELKVTGFPKPTVSWSKDGLELEAGGRFRFLYEDEESIALIIKNVTKDDGGLYKVTAVNDLGQAETKGQLIVKAPPRFVKKMVDMACMTEEKLHMQVVVEGSPKPDVKWYKDGQLIIASERIKFTELEDGRFQITIERVTLEDSGAYSVVASNAIGQMSEFWNLVAQQPAKIIRKLPAEFVTDLGSTNNQLTFSVQGVPEPTVTSTHGKVTTLGGGEYKLSFDAKERQNIKLIATAKNEFGSDTSECEVNVRRSVKITKKLESINVVEGEDGTLKVKIDAYPKPNKVKWFIDGVEISGKKYVASEADDEYKLVVKEVNANSDVKVIVENDLGADESNATITMQSKPSIKKGLEASYRLIESGSKELTVELNKTFPDPKGTWYHNGKEVEADARIKIIKKSSETYNLTFNVVKYEDAGEWSFKAQNDIGEVWSKTTIIVEGKPSFVSGLGKEISVIESERMELEVNVRDYCEEKVKIVWKLDSDVKLESSQVFGSPDTNSKIVLVPTAGCQKLTVTATNKHGEVSSQSQLVHVKLDPPVIKKGLDKEIMVKDGEKNFVLKVEVEGMPTPKLQWSFNGEKIEGQKSDSLIIPVFSQANIGQYTLEGVNVAGKALTEGNLKMLQTKPSFKTELKPLYEFKEGLEDLILSVDIDGSPIPVATWLKDGVEINDPRATVTNADGKSTLVVKGINPKDKGKYSVVLSNPNGNAQADTTVYIKPIPRTPTLLEPLTYPERINKKEKLKIVTRVDGEPFPSVQFFHNGKPLDSSLWIVQPNGNVTLTIENVDSPDQGVYSILVTNEAGQLKQDTKPIVVMEPPCRPKLHPPLTPKKIVEGLPLTFSTQISGYPPPSLKFTKNNEEILLNYTPPDFTYSKTAEPSDSGNYKLTAQNSEGKVESESLVQIISKNKEGPKYLPKFLTSLSDKKVDEGCEVTLSVKIDGNPLPDVKWEFGGKEVKGKCEFDGENAKITFIAERSDEGVYTCVLVNELGEIKSECFLTVNKIYKAPGFAQKFSDQEQIPLCDSKFGARISGLPTPTARWYKDGSEILAGEKYKIKQDGDLIQLQVRNCDDKDKGIYTCVLSNSQGTAECKAKLDVVTEISQKARGEAPYFLKTIGNTEVYPGMTAKFTACVGGTPNPDFEWFRGNEKIFESNRIRFERDGAGDGLIRLVIKNVDISDLNDYKLRIFNDKGEDHCVASLQFDSLSQPAQQRLGELYKGYEESKPTAIPNRPLITNMTERKMTLKWDPCLPHVSRVPCTYNVEMSPNSDDWQPLYKGLLNNYCNVDFPDHNKDYKFRVRVQWGLNVSEPSPYAITMRTKFDTRPSEWKPVLVPSIPRSYDLSRPPHDSYTHAPRFLNRENDYQYALLGHPATYYFYVYGYPKPTLKFFKNDVEYQPEFTYLDNGLISVFINTMTSESEGSYVCEARNNHGIARQQVQLKRADHPRFITRPSEVYALAQRSCKLSCRVYGIPIPDIKIYKDWHLLPLNSETRVRLTINQVDLFTIDVTVFIEESMRRDEGLYSIVATNVGGYVHSSAMIHVEDMEADYYFHSNLKGKDVRLRNLNVNNFYDFGDEIGRGTQAVHFHTVERASGSSYGCKRMVTRYDPRRKDWVESEYNIWNGLNHRNISRLHDAYHLNDTYYLFSDICTGGDLLGSLISRESFTEYDICFFIRQLLEGVDYLHTQNHIAHLGLTPLDLLLTHRRSDIIRIIDFSLSRKNYNRPLEYGQPEYVAPEIVKGDKNIGPWCDMWAIGIITYVLLTGHSPFLGDNDRETLENVKNGGWSFGDRFSLISSEGQDFIRRLLVYDFKGRLDISQALEHNWFNYLSDNTKINTNIQRDLHSSYYYKLKAWNENASTRGIYRRNPLEIAYKDPSKMVYPYNYIEEDDYKVTMPTSDQLKLNGYDRPDIGDFVNESHYQSGDETYLLQLRDTDFPARLRQYMKVAAHHSPSFQFQVYNSYCERNVPVIRERRKFTEIMDEEVDDERKNRQNLLSYDEYDGSWVSPRRLKNEVGTRLDIQAEADALRAMKRDGKEPVFREKPNHIINVKLGQQLLLTCVGDGDPKPTIQWFKNDMMVLASQMSTETTSTFELKSVTETDLTIYKIVLRNKNGQIISRFRLRLANDSTFDPSVTPETEMPPEFDYVNETTHPTISPTSEISPQSPVKSIIEGKFTSILSDGKKLYKICTELEFNTTKHLAHKSLFNVTLATQIGHSILLQDQLECTQPKSLVDYFCDLGEYSEQNVINVVFQLLDGMQYVHWQGLVLLNVDPSNVIIDKYQRVKIGDFSTAQPVLKIGSKVDSHHLITQFAAPEALNGEICLPQTDTWSIGILLYILLSGVSPFAGESDDDTKQNITYVRFHFEHLFKNVTQEATRLIMLIFKRSPLKRPSVDECMEHRWFQLTDHMNKKREKATFDSNKIKAYRCSLTHPPVETNLGEYESKYGALQK